MIETKRSRGEKQEIELNREDDCCRVTENELRFKPCFSSVKLPPTPTPTLLRKASKILVTEVVGKRFAITS